jgi:hypothetical protein
MKILSVLLISLVPFSFKKRGSPKNDIKERTRIFLHHNNPQNHHSLFPQMSHPSIIAQETKFNVSSVYPFHKQDTIDKSEKIVNQQQDRKEKRGDEHKIPSVSHFFFQLSPCRVINEQVLVRLVLRYLGDEGGGRQDKTREKSIYSTCVATNP